MYDKNPDIAALVSSRICHDLASPLGAIGNGLELLELSGISQTPEVVLLNESIEAANARIQFFRISFGAVSEGAMLSPEVIRRVLTDYYADKRVNVRWEHLLSVPRGTGKLLLLLVQCAETALPYGGEIRVHHKGNQWLLEGKGRLNMTKPVWRIFAGHSLSEPLQSSEVQFELATELARQSALRIKVNKTDETLQISLE
ncbi:MAG: histidine phosphotransferase [Rhodobacteraceae bacterium]|nr:histidine phosphotransferase [Paracoccaceae bacterium]